MYILIVCENYDNYRCNFICYKYDSYMQQNLFHILCDSWIREIWQFYYQ